MPVAVPNVQAIAQVCIIPKQSQIKCAVWNIQRNQVAIHVVFVAATICDHVGHKQCKEFALINAKPTTELGQYIARWGRNVWRVKWEGRYRGKLFVAAWDGGAWRIFWEEQVTPNHLQCVEHLTRALHMRDALCEAYRKYRRG